MTRATYTLTSPSQVTYGTHVASIHDALTGRETAHFVGSFGRRFSVVIGEPLCEGCDQPVADGLCDCQRRPAPVIGKVHPIKRMEPEAPVFAAAGRR